MINEFFDDLFGELSLGDNYSLFVFLFGVICVVGIFQLLKLILKLLFNR